VLGQQRGCQRRDEAVEFGFNGLDVVWQLRAAARLVQSQSGHETVLGLQPLGHRP